MKSTVKTIFIFLISILVTFSMPLYSNAETLSLDEIINAGDDFLGVAKQDDGVSDTELQELSKTVSNVLLTIAIGVTMISGAVMAINFTIQSVEDKAKIKESMVPWIIGIFVSFGAYGIWTITMNIFYKL